MTEENKSTPIPLDGFNEQEYLTTAIGFPAGNDDNRYLIYWKRINAPEGACPEIDAALKEAYGEAATLQTALDTMVGQFKTRPNYHLVGFWNIGEVDPEGITIALLDADGEELLAKDGSPKSDAIAKRKATDPDTGKHRTNSSYYGTLKSGGHEAMQEMASTYEVGTVRTATGGAKAKAKGFDALKAAAAEAGLDTTDPVAAMKALMEKAKEAGIL